MSCATHVRGLMLVFGIAGCATTTSPAVIESFDGPSTVTGLPAGWTLAETNGRGLPAAWGFGPGREGDGFGVIANRNFGATCSLAILEGVELADFDITIQLRALAGEAARGAGLVFGLRAPADYWVVEWDAKHNQVRLCRVAGGRLACIAEAPVGSRSDGWRELVVRRRGDRVVIRFAGESLIACTATGLPTRGAIGLWARADACAWFDELVIRDRSRR